MEKVSLLISSVSGFAAIVLGVIACLRTTRRDKKEEGYRDGSVLAELFYIRSGIDDIRHRQERQEELHVELVGRLSATEASVKQAHKRLDDICHRQ